MRNPDAPLPEPVTVPDDPESVTRLVDAAIVQATRDAQKGDFFAWMWLYSQDTGDVWGTVSGMDWNTVREWLFSKGTQAFVKEVYG